MIRSFAFSEGKLVGENLDPDALRLVRADKGISLWIDLFQPTAEETRTILEEVFNFHPLAIEDCVQVSERPKIEDYEDYLFMVMHAVDFSRKEHYRTTECDFFLGREFLVTHHTAPLRGLDLVIERIQKNIGQTGRGPERTLHTLLDALVNNYKPVLAQLTEEIQTLEDRVFGGASSREMMQEFLELKKEVAHLRSIVHAQVEVVARLAGGEFKILRNPMLPYFRDVKDNLIRIEEAAAHFSDQLYLSLDVYLNKASNEMNQIIKVLTLLTALTTPTVLIGTWYGMNFKGMPELEHEHGYLISAALNLVSTVGLLVWLRFKKWL
jgi:magnesium transporter